MVTVLWFSGPRCKSVLQILSTVQWTAKGTRPLTICEYAYIKRFQTLSMTHLYVYHLCVSLASCCQFGYLLLSFYYLLYLYYYCLFYTVSKNHCEYSVHYRSLKESTIRHPMTNVHINSTLTPSWYYNLRTSSHLCRSKQRRTWVWWWTHYCLCACSFRWKLFYSELVEVKWHPCQW